VESNRDRTKKFEVARIVEVSLLSVGIGVVNTITACDCQTIFANLVGFEIESFILFWDFLNKRFFFHLDAEHYNLCCTLKADLLKFYLVNAFKTKNKERITEFFSSYSHEILAEGGNNVAGTLRTWFVLPYLEEPDKDNDFAVYFSQRWVDLLRITLHNFLSVVLSSAPPPKLLLLEKWYRSEAQQEMRSQFLALGKRIEKLTARCDRYEERIQSLQDALRTVCSLLHKSTLSASYGANKSGSGALFDQEESELVAEERRTKTRDLGNMVSRLIGDYISKHHREKGSAADDVGNQTLDVSGADEMERELLSKVHEWTALLSSQWK